MRNAARGDFRVVPELHAGSGMRASGTSPQTHSHIDLSPHARLWPGWKGTTGFGSLLSELGVPTGQPASTGTGATAAQAVEESGSTASTVAAVPVLPSTASVAAAPAVEDSGSTASAVAAVTVSPSTASVAAGPAASPGTASAVTPEAATVAAPDAEAPASSTVQGTASADGRGLTTASGAPLIIPNTTPTGPYTGPAAYNPYYWGNCTYQAGNVAGYDNWFQSIKIGTLDPNSSQVDCVMYPRFSANQEGGQEALRLVQQFVPGATLVTQNFVCQLPGQPPSYDVKLPDGTVLSGGLVLSSYYNEGYGVTQGSDLRLEASVGLVSP